MKISTIQHIIDQMDDRMQKHANNVACMCYAMGQTINCSPKELENIWFAGMLLDSGKLVMENKIKLDNISSEDDYIVYSEKLASQFEGFEDVATILSQSHENVDGTGEPNHIKGEAIDTLAKVVRISDYYDNFRLDGKTHEESCREIRKLADQVFPKKIITPFIKCIVKNELHKEYNKEEEDD